MRQAIITRYAGPTDHHGSRVLVRAQAGRMVVPWDHALDVADNHTAAAMAYAAKRQWFGRWHGGDTPDGHGYCYVMASDGPATFTVLEQANAH